MTTTWVHPFERSGLGKAPYRCTNVTKNMWVSGCGTVQKPGGTCAFCGTGILYEYHIEGADGRKFKVGSDCVAHTGAQAPEKKAGEIEGFRAQRLKLAREKRAATQETKRQTRAAEREARYAKWEAERLQRYADFSVAEPMVCSILDKLLLDADPDAPASFMVEMAHAVRRYGSLTAGQLAAVKASIERSAQREADKANSEFIGEVGRRIEGSFEIIATRSWENSFVWPPRTVFWTLMKKDGRDICSYKGNYLGERGEIFRAKFSVKEYETYNGTRQTKLQRPAMAKEAKGG